MLVNVPSYFGIVRKSVVVFGSLFSNIYTFNKDTDNKTQKIVKVPIAYAPKQKFIVRLQQDPSLTQDVLVSLPRLSFEMLDPSYDSVRQLSKTNHRNSTVGRSYVTQYTPAPYDLRFNLFSYTATMEDNLMIMEQILPFFRPDLTIRTRMLDNPDTKQELPLILESVVTEDLYDGSFEERRSIITTYSFSMKVNMYGPLYGLIDEENHFDDGDGDGNSRPLIKKAIVDLNNSKYIAEIDPITANPGDEYVIKELWDEKNYDE